MKLTGGRRLGGSEACHRGTSSLTIVLKLDHKIAEKDACQMEHAVSSETIERLVDFLIDGGYCSGFNNLADETESD